MLRTPALIVLHAAAGKTTGQIADAVGYDPSAVLNCCTGFGPTPRMACGTTGGQQLPQGG